MDTHRYKKIGLIHKLKAAWRGWSLRCGRFMIRIRNDIIRHRTGETDFISTLNWKWEATSLGRLMVAGADN